MRSLVDKKQMHLDMLEHPERYTDQQLEAMMDDIDRLPDVEKAWEQFHPQPLPVRGDSGHHSVWRKVAAVFVAGAFLAGLAWAIIPHFVSLRTKSTPSVTTPLPTREGQGGESVCFDNIRLDSILTIVSGHYKRKLCLDNDSTGAMRLTTVWNSERPLAEFIETLNEFDGLHLTDRDDTLFVESVVKEEE